MQPDVTDPSRSHMTVGAVVADTYKLERLIGRGGMGDVFAASHLRIPKRFAIKFLHPEVADPEIIARFRREAEIAGQLGHPNIVGVTDFNQLPNGTPYLVLDFLEGETLDDALAHGPLSLERTLAIARQVGSGLAAAHRAGIVHRDLKPANIFLVPTEIGGHITELAKILDFGISKIRGSQTVKTQDSALLGTPQYMSPEQATGQHASIDGRTDIFAFGAILYEMLTGRAAFAGASIPEVVFKVVYEQPAPLAELAPGLPSSVVAAIERAMQKKPDDRFADMGEMVTALTGVGLATLPAARTPSPGTPPIAAGTGRKVSSADALAKTMGSGDHAEAMLGTAATAYERPSGASAPAAAGTLPPAVAVAAAPTAYPGAAHPAPAYPAPPSPSAHPAYPAGAPLPATAPGAGPWKWVAIGTAGLLAVVVAFLVVSKRADAPTPPAPAGPLVAQAGGQAPPVTPPSVPPGTPSVPPGAPPQPPTTPVTAPPDAGAAGSDSTVEKPTTPTSPPATPKPGKPGKPDKPTAPKPPPDEPSEPSDEPGDLGEVAENVKRAWLEVAGGNDVVAKKLANSILDSKDSPAKAKGQAHQILTLIACRADDRETAVRHARSARRPLPRVVKACNEHDIELPRR